MQKFSDILQVIQFQGSNLVSAKLPFNCFLCEKTVSKRHYKKLLPLHVLNNDRVAIKEQLYKPEM